MTGSVVRSALPAAVGAVAVLLPRLFISRDSGVGSGIFEAPIISLNVLDLIVVVLSIVGSVWVTQRLETKIVTVAKRRESLGGPASAADDSTYGTNSKIPGSHSGSSSSLASAIAEAHATPPSTRIPGSTPLGESDIDVVVQDLVRIQNAYSDPIKSDLGPVIRRLKEVIASDDFMSPRFNTVDSVDRSIIQYVEGHGATVKPRRPHAVPSRPSFERLRCRSLVDEAENAAKPPSHERTARSPSERDADLRHELEDSLPDGELHALAAVARGNRGSKVMPVGVPVWQRGLDQVTIDDDLLASWDFDPFAHCRIAPDSFGSDLWSDNSVSGVGIAMQILTYHGVLDELKFDHATMKRYLRNVEQAYPRNPYHNRIHALDVMQTCHSVLVHTPHLLSSLDPIEKLALLLGAYVHDVGHPGVNNKLLMRLADDPKNELHPDFAVMSIRYSNHSVCEFYHLATAFEIAFEGNDVDANPFCNLSTPDFAKLRQLLIELVLATDMEQHFNLMARMKVATGAGSDEDGTLMDLTDPDKKLLILKAVLHGCDISNPAKPTTVCQKWCVAITEEFYRQGDLETKSGLSPDKMHIRCDLSTSYGRLQKANGQLAFIKFIVRPLHEVLALQLPIFKNRALSCIDDNVRYWEQLKVENGEE